MKVSVTVSGLRQLFGKDLAAVVDVARVADDAGIDQIVMPDHLAMGARTDRYPFGEFPYPPDEPWLEPLTVLAAMASATRRVRLATGVLIGPAAPGPARRPHGRDDRRALPWAASTSGSAPAGNGRSTPIGDSRSAAGPPAWTT